jgi:putative transposase
LDEAATEVLRNIFAKVCEDFGAELKACDGEDDHVHLLVEYPPTVLLPTLVNSLKGVSSRLLRQQRPDIVRRYWKNVLWSPSYFAASCGGAPLADFGPEKCEKSQLSCKIAQKTGIKLHSWNYPLFQGIKPP